MSQDNPYILNVLIASGDDVTSKQLRDDLMTLLIAGHETTAAVLTWTTFLLATHPDIEDIDSPLRVSQADTNYLMV